MNLFIYVNDTRIKFPFFQPVLTKTIIRRIALLKDTKIVTNSIRLLFFLFPMSNHLDDAWSTIRDGTF